MASTPTQNDLPSWATLERLTDDTTRFVDLCGVFRRNDAAGDPTGEVLFEVGGRWDRVEGRYCGEPERCKTWGVNEAQIRLMEAAFIWIDKRQRSDDSRDIILEAGGARGGGKSHGCVLIAEALALHLPGSKAWIFNPTLDKREEIEDIIKATLPRAWAKNALRWPTSVPDCRFRLVNDSSIRNLSGEIPQSAKRGEAECILINEGQLQRRKVYSLSLYGIRKRGGLLMVATNPPEESFPAGDWVMDLREKIEAGRIAGTYHEIDPRKNPSVHAPTMAKIATAIDEVDPRAGAADVHGIWKRLGEFAYGNWIPVDRLVEGVLRKSMVRPAPDIGDITAEALRRAGAPIRPVAIGTDHQTTPHQAAAAVKVFPHIGEGGKPTGKNCYYVTDEVIVSGSSVTEIDLSDALYHGEGAAQIEYAPDTALLVPDCSADFQVSNRESGVTSIKVLESQNWRCKPPTEIKRPDRSSHPKNPPVHHSLAQMADVMREGRFFVSPECRWTIEALEKTPLKRDGDRVKISQAGGYAHVCDCIRYVIWLLEPKKKRAVKPLNRSDIQAIDVRPNRIG